jgi:peptide-methionine (S)-S-oxide reductase
MATQIATLAGGCFWCTDAVFRRLKGIHKVVTGYSGGTLKNPSMEQVYRGDTGHAECIQIEFDPSVMPYEKLLEIFFHFHDPTVTQQPGTLDSGDEYRSVIFYHDEEQKKIAENVMKKVESEKLYKGRILTELVLFDTFYPAKESHQEYYEKNSYQPYCQYIIDPKLAKLLSEYRNDLKPEFKQ